MPDNDKLCIICNIRKPEFQFESKGEHIVPRFLGSRKLRTPYVCKVCNGGLGGTVDIALKNVPDVALACIDRGVVGAYRDTIYSALKFDDLFAPPADTRPVTTIPENPDIKGAILKIAYETAHLRLGNNWLYDPIATNVREVLFAYVRKDKEAARANMANIPVCDIPIELFYASMNRSRSEIIKKAIGNKSCLNGLWVVPFIRRGGGQSLAVVIDIEGLPTKYVTVSNAYWPVVTEPELLSPILK